MDVTAIHDTRQQLIAANEDLRGVCSMILTVGDHPEYANAYEVLKVIDRALRSIADDIQEAIEGLDTTLTKMKEENVQQD